MKAHIKAHLPGLSTAAALTLIPSVAEAVEPGSLPAMGPDAPAWMLPLLMGLTYLGSKLIEVYMSGRSHDAKAQAAELVELREDNARLREEIAAFGLAELEQTKRIYQLEAELEVEEAIHAAVSASHSAPHQSNLGRDPHTT